MSIKDRFAKNFGFLFWVSAFFLLIFLDQYTKVGTEKVFLNDQFAFSLPLPLGAIYAVYAIVLAFSGLYFIKYFSTFEFRQKIGWLLVWSGAFSNVGERLVYGYVRDWIYIFNGVFNLADGYILLGIMVLLFSSRQAGKLDLSHNQPTQ